MVIRSAGAMSVARITVAAMGGHRIVVEESE